MNISGVLKQLKMASPVATPIEIMIGLISSKNEADQMYKEIHPLLEDFLSQGYTYESKQVQHIVNILRELSAYGVKKHNFEKYYLRDEASLRKLPKDPSDIPYGFWH